MSTSDTATRKGLAPPYTAFQSLKGVIATANEHGVLPGRYDRSVLGNFSGAVAGQLLLALRFLELTDERGVPQPSLEKLVEVYGTDKWRRELGAVLKMAYAPIFELNLLTAIPSQFNEKFQATYTGEGDTLRKAITFFLNAAGEAGIPLGQFLTKGKKTRRVGQRRRTSKTSTSESASGGHDTAANSETRPDPSANDMVAQLLAKFPKFDPAWSDDLKAKWFDGFGKFMGMATPKGSDGSL